MKQGKVRLDSSDELLAFADSLIEGVVKRSLCELSLAEEDVQPTNAAAPAAVNPAPQQQQAPNPYAAKNHPQEDFEEPTVDMVVDKLNAIRSGRSFRDSSVKGAMATYFEKLSKEERAALLAFLKGISQIVTGEVQGEQATDPNDTPAPGIKMTPTSSSVQAGKKVKNVTIVKAPQKSASTPGGEDSSAPVPIKPKVR